MPTIRGSWLAPVLIGKGLHVALKQTDRLIIVGVDLVISALALG
jgi:hypothetical protein